MPWSAGRWLVTVGESRYAPQLLSIKSFNHSVRAFDKVCSHVTFFDDLPRSTKQSNYRHPNQQKWNTYHSTSATFAVCSQSSLLASSDPRNFFVPRSSPLSPIRKAPCVALSKPCSMYSPLSWYEEEMPNTYPSPMTTYEAARMMGESEVDIMEVCTSPG